MDKQRSLEELAVEIESESLLSELKESATQMVKGAGSFDADIVFIGEAPGKNEDVKGIPFVGASGRILNDGLLSVGINRDEIYITNIVKFRPPGNRDPSTGEKEASLPYLMREINIIKPKIIAPLGRHSLSTILPEAKIGQDHGKSFTVQIEQGKYTVIPLYHPAATIYNRAIRADFVNDLHSLKDALELID